MRFAAHLLSLIVLLILNNLLFSIETPDNKTNYEPNIVVIKFLPEYKAQIQNHSQTGFGFADLDRTLSKIGVTKIDSRFHPNPKKYRADLPDLSLIYQINYSKAINPYSVADMLLQCKYLQYAEPSFIDEIMEDPDDPKYSQLLYLAALQAPQAWSIHKGQDSADTVIIAIVDTGVNWKHPDIKDNIWINNAELPGITINWTTGTISGGNGIDDDGNGKIDDVIGWDFMLTSGGAEGNNPSDAYGHGSSVAGIADARTNNTAGVCSIPWNVKLMPISCSYPGTSLLSKSYSAIVYAAENEADVINYSAGGSTSSQANEDAIVYACGLGSVIVAAAGNSGSSAIIYPAGYPGVVAVASVYNTGVKSSVSSFGRFVDVCAPADSIYSINTGTGYSTWSLGYGTSYATPIASGLAALIKSYHHEWSNEQVINQMISTCTNLDTANPSYVNLLGDGMLNAYAALTETNPTAEQELRLNFKEVLAPSDANGNHALERNELFSLNLKVQNYAHNVSSNNVTYTLSCSDPFITIISNTYNGTLPQNGYGLLTNAFQCRVSNTATTKAVTFTLSVTADLPITSGSTMTFSIVINAGGVFVWEGKAEAGYSGRKIRDSLTNQGYSVYYTTTFPLSFSSFSAVFLCFGMVSSAGFNATRFDNLSMFQAVKDYLLEGGRIYIEGNDAIGWDLSTYLPDVGEGLSAAQVLFPLLGIATYDDGGTNGINGLAGQVLAVTNGINFTATTQTKIESIDKFTPSSSGAVAFIESGYGNVAIQNYGSYGQKSFVMSYCLAELTDAAPPSTRDSLLHRIMTDFTTVETTMVLAVPNVSIARVSNTVSLSWSAVPYAVSYRIESSNSPYSGFTTETTITQTAWNAPETFPQKYYKVIARTSGL